MDHARWIEAASARLDGELGPAEAGQLDRHLRHCRSCRAIEAALAGQHRRFRVYAAPVPPDLAAAVLPRPRRRGRWAAVIAGTAAAVAVAATLAVQTSAPDGPAPALAIGSVTALTGPRDGASVVLLRVANHGGSDRVVGAASPLATSTEFHQVDHDRGAIVMHTVASVPVPAGGATEFSPDATHLMLLGLHVDLHEGDRVPLALTFARSGTVLVDAVVSG